MKIKTQKAMFVNNDLIAVISNNKKISKNRFAWNLFNHPQKELWIPQYIKALRTQLHTPYKSKAKHLLIRLIKTHTKLQSFLNLPPLQQIESVSSLYKKIKTPSLEKEQKNLARVEKAQRKIERFRLPLSEYRAKSQDNDFILKIKKTLRVFSKYDPQIRYLRSRLTKNVGHSHDPALVVDLPHCQKTLLVPHPHDEKHMALYFQSVLSHKARVLISLCSPYEHHEVLPFWEGREIEDENGQTISCVKISERVLYQSPMLASIRDEKRAKYSADYGGIDSSEFFPRIVERRLCIKKGDESHETIHLHYENWPDHQEAPDLKALEVLIEQRDALATPDDVCMLNCKATIGRSGLFFYSDLAKNRIKAMVNEGVPLEEMTFNFAAMVLEVRRYRPILSGNFTQLGQVFERIADLYDTLVLEQKMFCEKEEMVEEPA